MSEIYISSTYEDLRDHRMAVYRALRKMRHDVISMEDYSASDQRPLDKCLADMAGCDIYIGIFAWRYGYIPPNQSKSITELELREATRTRKKCLIFLLDENAPWARNFIDRESENIDTLRDELKRNYLTSFFQTPEGLATAVTAAVYNAQSEDKAAPQPKTEEGAALIIGGESLLAKRMDVYKDLWSKTNLLPQWPRATEVTYEALTALSKEFRDWYFDQGGMFLSTEAREVYGDLQETIKQVVEEKPSGLISAEHYDLIRNMCSRLRTALTNDLQSRRGSS